MRSLVLGAALASVLAGAAHAQSPQPRPAVTPKGEAKPAAPAAQTQEKCAGFAGARNAALMAEIKPVLVNMPQPGANADEGKFRAEVEEAYTKAEARARTGDVEAMRQMLGIELFVSEIQRRPAGDGTLRKACFLADMPDARRSILNVLTCAVLSLEPARRDDEAQRTKAQAMMERAEKMVPANAGAASVAKVLFEDVKRGLAGCY